MSFWNSIYNNYYLHKFDINTMVLCQTTFYYVQLLIKNFLEIIIDPFKQHLYFFPFGNLKSPPSEKSYLTFRTPLFILLHLTFVFFAKFFFESSKILLCRPYYGIKWGRRNSDLSHLICIILEQVTRKF